ncbi:ABC transporter ATP-binding protein [Gordonia insulae]|uniref:Putative ABC transporter ATP-binding protein n=1 Tax=Gordonia insulae TaxID=2420509 RepID=A0A3G8JMS8_9ACTN|nr:ABC transporter ATP-binding protein [Gordonia insulae]AZG46293.1 putative ABC transporter ATP-binding protein [Gordonia insulae]
MSALPVADRRETTRWLRAALRARIATVVAVSALCVVTAVCAVIPVLALGILVDRVTDHATASSLIPVAIVAAGAAAIGGLAAGATMYSVARLGADVIAELRADAVDTALHLPRAVFEASGRGDLLSRVNNDVTVINRAVTTVVPTVVTAAALTVVSVIAMAGLDWRLGLAGATAIPFYILALRWYVPRSSPVYAAERAAAAERAQAIVESVSSRDTVAAYGLRDRELARIESTSAGTRDLAVSVFTLFTRLVGRVNRAEFIGLAAILSVGFLLVSADAVTVGATTAAALLFHRLFNPIGMILYSSAELQLAGAGFTRLVGVIRSPRHGPADAPGHREPAAPMHDTLGVSLRDVHFGYTPERPVLRGLDLDIVRGTRLALVGASGAGKSTVAGLVDGSLRADRGSIRTPAGARVFTVSQEVHLFAGPLLEDLRLAAPDATRAQAFEALRVVGADDWVRALPSGIDTVVGEGGHRLGDARAQQVALARLVLADPDIAVLDEATAEADSDQAAGLDSAAEAATDGRTTLVIAHRLTQALAADTVAVLSAGVVTEYGPPDELITAGGELARLWHASRAEPPAQSVPRSRHQPEHQFTSSKRIPR